MPASSVHVPALYTAAEQDLQLDTRQMFRRVQNVPALAEAYQQYHQKQGQQGGQGSLRPPGQLQQL